MENFFSSVTLDKFEELLPDHRYYMIFRYDVVSVVVSVTATKLLSEAARGVLLKDQMPFMEHVYNKQKRKFLVNYSNFIF